MGEGNRVGIIDRVRSDAATQARDSLGLTTRYVAPSGPIEVRLAEIWSDALEVDRVGAADDFFELGGDSLNGTQVFTAIEHEFGTRLPLAALVEGPTIRAIASRIEAAETDGEWGALVPIQIEGGRPPLFCIHELTGNVVVYRLLAQHLGEDQPVYGLQYPGQNRARPEPLRLEEMARRYIDDIRSVQPHGPYYLAGFSLGGVIAYEIARRLRTAGEPVALLALIDAGAPGYHLSGLAKFGLHAGEFLYRWPWTWPSYLLRRWRNRAARRRKDAALFRSPSEHGLGARLRRVTTEILPRAKPGYRPKPYDGRVVLFRCSEDIVLWRRTPELGWRPFVAGGIEIQDIPATHQYLMQDPAVAVLAAHLATCIENADASARGDRDPSLPLLSST